MTEPKTQTERAKAEDRSEAELEARTDAIRLAWQLIFDAEQDGNKVARWESDPYEVVWNKAIQFSEAATRGLRDQLEAAVTALRFYQQESEAIHKHLVGKKSDAVMASVTVLSLDEGKRASAAIRLAQEYLKKHGGGK